MTITPIGIVRNVPATIAQPGQCDAILNLRPEGGAWKAAGVKTACYAAYAEGATLLQAHVHQLPNRQCLVVVRRLPDGWLQVAAAPLAAETVAPQWQVLHTFPAGTTNADALRVHVAFIGNYCCVSTPLLRVFRFNGAVYVEESGVADSAPALNYSVQGRYTAAGSLLSFAVPVRGENLEGCYYREAASKQYTAAQLAGTNYEAVSLNQGTVNTPTQWGNLVFGEADKQALLDAMAGQYDAMQQSSAYHREGYVLVCSAWQLPDGTYTCPSEPVLLHLGCEQVADDFRKQTSQNFDPTTDIDVFFNRDKISFKIFAASDISASSYSAAVFSCYVRRQWMQQLTFHKPDVPATGAGVFQKAVYFVSPPVSMYCFAKAEFEFLHTIHHYGIDVATKGLVAGGAGVDSYYRLALKHSAIHREGLTEYLPSAGDVAGWVLYKAVEFDLTDPSEVATKRVDFSTLTANEVLGAELAGHLSVSCGGLLAYNQRLHVWNCASTFKGLPVSSVALADVPAGFIYRYAESAVTTYITQRYVVPGPSGGAFVRAVGQNGESSIRQVVAQYRIANGSDYLYHYRTLGYRQVFANAGGNLWLAYPRFLSFPDNRCDQCTLFYQTDGGWRSVSFPMHPSAGFNFSFALHLAAADGLNTDSAAYLPLKGGTPVADADVQRLLNADGRTFAQPVTVEGFADAGELLQPDLLMVSAPANPYVFPPELAFHYGAPVTAAEVSTREISSAQTGQYPLCVFTDGGIWSMELGTSAFYSRQVPVSAEVNTGNRVLATPFGIVFLSAGGTKLLQGRQVSLLGSGVQGSVQTAVWACPQMAAVLDGAGGRLSEAAGLADQHTAFPDGIAQWLKPGCALGYDAAHHELLVSGGDLPLTYVFSFTAQQWYTFSDVFFSFSGNLAVRKRADGGLCFLSDEAGGASAFRPVALMSRPFAPWTLGYQHIDRLTMYGELKGGAPSYSGLYLLASNNLSDWRIVSAVQWQHPLSPQVRLPRSKRSWRFYAYALFADVPAGFSVSHLEIGR